METSGSCQEKERDCRNHTRREALLQRGKGLAVQWLTICPQDASPTSLERIPSLSRVPQESVFPCRGETRWAFSISWVSLTTLALTGRETIRLDCSIDRREGLLWIKLPKASLGVGWGRGCRGENGGKASRLYMMSAGWGSGLIQAVHCPGIWSPCLT